MLSEWRICTVGWILIGLTTMQPAHTQGITLDGVARSYSTSYFMRTLCPKFIAVNVGFAEKYGSDTLELGAKMFGKAETMSAVAAEIERRRAEVVATGEAAWCSYQRTTLQGRGLLDLFK